MKRAETAEGLTTDHRVIEATANQTLSARRRLIVLALVFLVALGVRLLNWHEAGNDALAVQSSVALNYKHLAELLRANGLSSLYDKSSTTNIPDLMGHPPGYPILLSFIYRSAGESAGATQLLQITLDSVSVVIIMLIAFELFPAPVGIITGLMAAFAPQLSWNSLTLLPDSLTSLPILLALLLIARSLKKLRWPSLLLAGALIGVSVWLRANALLLAPFIALVFLFTSKRERRLPAAMALLAGALLVIAPLTIRNGLVFGKFIPVSLGAGQTLLEGLADYNSDGSLGLPATDQELLHSEAETFQRPDYANSLFTPDGIARDHARVARGVSVIRAHPIWFSGVMVRRAASMLRLERTPLRLRSPNAGLIGRALRLVQKLFITAIFLPLVLVGAALLAYRREVQSLALLLVVPFYYFCTQSALHTEYRYVLVINYFLFILAAVALYSIIRKLSRRGRT
jgi:4-amino-4-deoxy-L-arabinose transferase-like glycosyltransferase